MTAETIGTPIRVVLADDHAVVRHGIRQFLELASGISVVAEAVDGEEALRLVRQHQPDVVVLDIQMPGKSGIDVAHPAPSAARHFRPDRFRRWPTAGHVAGRRNG
jgi:DNA-binding NarL/FixJ family response regulator